MKQLLIMTALISGLGISSMSFAAGDHPHSDERDVMRVHKPDIDKDSLNTSHADRKKGAQLDTRRMKSQIISGTKVTGQDYSEDSPIVGASQKRTSHPLRTKRMGDH